MGRDLASQLASALSDGLIVPVFLAQLTFRSATRYVWSGVGTLSYGGQNYAGVGSLASIGGISEGISVQADGTSVTLSGIEKMLGQSPDFLTECLSDIRAQAPAILWFGLMSGTAVLATYQVFRGIIDKPTLNLSADTISITLALESRLLDLGRASGRRYTSADQNVNYPDDSGFDWVEIENDIAVIWGN
ncbi:hypothetical protein GCM10011507_33500 [Edaphobacter acidisoli]|uniref:DUF2163 domain-containing protein n=1 Tax=Edaphobacter acidisoli TaxID=2040573 RepID=A0A916S0T8_9BACT|nr:hypothetical protein [Edaphobacter acidisoli]GGA79559.1 hypothetical protein GCM10011507_33500 [Edaphobacter acidisoli]